jgi:hypothetical protein
MGTWFQYLTGCQKPKGFGRHTQNLRECCVESWGEGKGKFTPASLAGLFPWPPLQDGYFARVLVGLSVGCVDIKE